MTKRNQADVFPAAGAHKSPTPGAPGCPRDLVSPEDCAYITASIHTRVDAMDVMWNTILNIQTYETPS